MSSSRSKVLFCVPGTVLLDDLNAGVEVLEAVWVDDAVGVDAVVEAEGEDGDLAAEAGVEAHLGRDTSGISGQWRLTLVTQSVWAVSVCRHEPVSRHHTRTLS